MFDLKEIENMSRNLTCLYDKTQVELAIDRISKEVTNVLSNKYPLLLCTMNGAVIFTGQLLTRLDFPLQIDYIHASRFKGSMEGGDLEWVAVPRTSLEDRTVVIVEDILDSGITLASVIDHCRKKGAKEVYTVVLVDKDHKRDINGVKKADFTGLYVEDKFLVGFGLDYQGFFRNLSGIYAVNT